MIDEIQRAPELLSVVHSILEEPAPPRFVLTGSSVRKLRSGRANLLGSRALGRTMHPFMAAELPHFDLQRALRTGLVPLVVDSSNPEETLSAYASLYIDQEVRAEGLTRDLGAFARFLEAISFSHGGRLNISAVARECEVERKVVAGYIGILEDLLMAFRIPVFRKRAKRATVVRDKLYLFDSGVFRSLRPAGPLDRAGDIHGQALEGLVAQHLRAWVAYSQGDASVFYWRTRAGTEVHFVVYGRDGFHAFEVKNARAVRAFDLRALRTFRADYPEADAVLLHRGRERMRMHGIWCLPVEDFLREMVPGRGLLEWVGAGRTDRGHHD